MEVDETTNASNSSLRSSELTAADELVLLKSFSTAAKPQPEKSHRHRVWHANAMVIRKDGTLDFYHTNVNVTNVKHLIGAEEIVMIPPGQFCKSRSWLLAANKTNVDSKLLSEAYTPFTDGMKPIEKLRCSDSVLGGVGDVVLFRADGRTLKWDDLLQICSNHDKLVANCYDKLDLNDVKSNVWTAEVLKARMLFQMDANMMVIFFSNEFLVGFSKVPRTVTDVERDVLINDDSTIHNLECGDNVKQVLLAFLHAGYLLHNTSMLHEDVHIPFIGIIADDRRNALILSSLREVARPYSEKIDGWTFEEHILMAAIRRLIPN